jgi:CheY-like chemotaxis protein
MRIERGDLLRLSYCGIKPASRLENRTIPYGISFQNGRVMPPDPPATTVDSRGVSTVLVVEDEPHVRELVRAVLARGGYAVVAASDAEEALALYRADPARIDLVLSDVLMPGRSGAELATQLRTITPHVPVLLMSGYTGGRVEACSLPPDIQVLEKPFKLDGLLAAVAAAVRK